MITKVRIKNLKTSPLSYLKDVDLFRHRKSFKFKPGTNIITGENGSGKSTLLKLIEIYSLVDFDMTKKSMVSMNAMHSVSGKFLDGVDVYGSYDSKIYRLTDRTELLENDNGMSSFMNFEMLFNDVRSSRGQSVKQSVAFMIDKISKDIKDNGGPWFDFRASAGNNEDYLKYTEDHTVLTEKAVTLTMDEPDNNLDINSIDDVYGMLAMRRPDMQIISVVHNPILIYMLSRLDYINFIETTPGYVESVRDKIDKITEK